MPENNFNLYVNLEKSLDLNGSTVFFILLKANYKNMPIGLSQLFNSVPAFYPLKKYLSDQNTGGYEITVPISRIRELLKDISLIGKGWPGEQNFSITTNDQIKNIVFKDNPQSLKIKYIFNTDNFKLIPVLPKNVLIQDNCLIKRNEIFMADVKFTSLINKPYFEGKEIIEFLRALPGLQKAGFPGTSQVKISNEHANEFNIIYVDKEQVTLVFRWLMDKKSLIGQATLSGWYYDPIRKLFCLGVSEDIVKKYVVNKNGSFSIQGDDIKNFLVDAVIPDTGCFVGEFQLFQLMHGIINKKMKIGLQLFPAKNGKYINGNSIIKIGSRKYKVSSLNKELIKYKSCDLLKFAEGWVSFDHLAEELRNISETADIPTKEFINTLKGNSKKWNFIDTLNLPVPEFDTIEKCLEFTLGWEIFGGAVVNIDMYYTEIINFIENHVFENPSFRVAFIEVGHKVLISKIPENLRKNIVVISYQRLIVFDDVKNVFDMVFLTQGEAFSSVANFIKMEKPLKTKSVFAFVNNEGWSTRFIREDQSIFTVKADFYIWQSVLFREKETDFSAPNVSVSNLVGSKLSNLVYAKQNKKENFLVAAEKYKDTIVDSAEFVEWYSYKCSYSEMSNRQMSYYFFWRNCVKNGIYYKSCQSYILLFFNELAAGVGWIDPLKGFHLMLNVYSIYKDEINRNDCWLFDFALKYDILFDVFEDLIINTPKNIRTEISDILLSKYGENDISKLPPEYIFRICNRNLKMYTFYSENVEKFKTLSCQVFKYIENVFQKRYGKSIFQKFATKKLKQSIYLFLFSTHHELHSSLSLEYSKIIHPAMHGNFMELITNVCKLIENRFRNYYHFSGKLKVSIEDQVLRNGIENFLSNKLRGRYKHEEDYKKIDINIDFDKAKQLDAESDLVRDMLIVWDESIESQIPVSINTVIQNTPEQEPKLSQEQYFVLACIKNKELASIPNRDMVIDSINEKAVSYLGDIIIDISSGEPVIVDENYEDFCKIIGGENGRT